MTARSPFGVTIDEKVALFIDGSNLYTALKNCGFECDYAKLIGHFEREDTCKFLRATYYTAIATEEDEFTPIKPLVDYLEYNGFVLNSKPVREFVNSEGVKRYKTSMDMEMAVDLLNYSHRRLIDHAILFTGDGEFIPVVKAMRDCGVRVTIVSAKGQTNADLRRAADRYVDLADLKPLIEKAPRTVRA